MCAVAVSGTVIDIKGDAGGFLRRFANMYPDFMDRSIRHAAYLTQNRLKAELLARVPGGVEFPPISKVQRFRLLGKVSKKTGKRRLGPIKAHGLAYNMNGGDWPPGGKLAQTIKYIHVKGSMRADIGWLSKGTVGYGRRFQQGEKQFITPRMRRLFAAAGIFIKKDKKFLIQPPRPVFRPFFKNRKTWIQNRIVERMRYYVNGEAFKRMKYEFERMRRRIVA